MSHPFFKIVLGLWVTGQAGAAVPVKCFRESVGANGDPERTAAKLLKGEPEAEVFQRLIFAETIASHCTGGPEEDGVVQAIAWVVANRARQPKRFGHGVNVVLAPKQFRSSLGRYGGARRSEFLCPQSFATNWEPLWNKAGAAWKAAQGGSKSPLPDVYNYYLPLHLRDSKVKLARPAWAAAPNSRVTAPGLDKDSGCLELWKVADR